MGERQALAALVVLLLLCLAAAPAPAAQRTFTLHLPGCTA